MRRNYTQTDRPIGNGPSRIGKTLAGACLVAAMLGGVANAGPLMVGEQVEVGNQNGNAFTPSPVNGDTNGLYSNISFLLDGERGVNAAAGAFVLDYRQSGGEWEQFVSFCLQPDVYLMPFSNPYEVTGLSASPYQNDAWIAELWGRHRNDVTNDIGAAAFQVALWELAYGVSDRNLGSGAFRLTSSGAVFDLAQSWLTEIDGSGPMAEGLMVLVNNPQLTDRQDLLTANPTVPEPGTLALLGIGLVGIAAVRHRRRRAVA
ncbi:MAG: PEP-CTERM sorting domain-containing protein [Steroidobacteraceae bacterium]